MNTAWIANHDPSCFWALRSSPSFSSAVEGELIALWPLHAFTTKPGQALGHEELGASRILRNGIPGLGSIGIQLFTLPPWRFAPAVHPEILFGMDPDLILEAWHDIGVGLRDSGVRKLVFYPTNALYDPLCATAAVDLRQLLGLDTYVISTGTLQAGIDSENRETETSGASALLAEWLQEIAAHRTRLKPCKPMARQTSPEDVARRWPAWEEWYIGRQTLAALSSPATARKLAVLPIGSIEQHGPHLPVGVDVILGEAMLAAALPHLGSDAGVWVTPPLTYGKSNEHTGFAGTLTLSARTLRGQILAIAGQLKAMGFDRLALFNTHGGNTSVLRLLVPEIQHRLGVRATLVRHGFKPDMDAHEAAWGLHAGEWETSLMLACAADTVQMNAACCEFPVAREQPGRLRPERAPVVFGWLTRDLVRSGVMGDATKANAEKGLLWLKQVGIHLAERLKACAQE